MIGVQEKAQILGTFSLAKLTVYKAIGILYLIFFTKLTHLGVILLH